jgi:hypothetical protein
LTTGHAPIRNPPSIRRGKNTQENFGLLLMKIMVISKGGRLNLSWADTQSLHGKLVSLPLISGRNRGRLEHDSHFAMNSLIEETGEYPFDEA